MTLLFYYLAPLQNDTDVMSRCMQFIFGDKGEATYSSHDLNSKLKVRYSGHGLNSKQIVHYSGHRVFD